MSKLLQYYYLYRYCHQFGYERQSENNRKISILIRTINPKLLLASRHTQYRNHNYGLNRKGIIFVTDSPIMTVRYVSSLMHGLSSSKIHATVKRTMGLSSMEVRFDQIFRKDFQVDTVFEFASPVFNPVGAIIHV